MKPKDLRCPVSWDERRPVMHEGVLFIPPYYDRHAEWGKIPRIENLAIEYCSGNGDWVIAKALEDPKRPWIAVEKRFDRVRKIWSKMQNKAIPNLLIVCGEALTFTRHYLENESVQEIYINFPDPWPKRGHAKHRLIQKSFVEEMARASSLNGTACLVTDDPDYSDQMVKEMSPVWKPQFSYPHYTLEWPNYGRSFFDTLWRAKGCSIRYHVFKRGEG